MKRGQVHTTNELYFKFPARIPVCDYYVFRLTFSVTLSLLHFAFVARKLSARTRPNAFLPKKKSYTASPLTTVYIHKHTHYIIWVSIDIASVASRTNLAATRVFKYTNGVAKNGTHVIYTYPGGSILSMEFGAEESIPPCGIGPDMGGPWPNGEPGGMPNW